MYLGTVDPDTQFTGIAKPAVMPGRQFIDTGKLKTGGHTPSPGYRTMEVRKDPVTGEWKHPTEIVSQPQPTSLLPERSYPIVVDYGFPPTRSSIPPSFSRETSVSVPVAGQFPPWVWVAGAVAAGLLIWMVARNA